MKILKLLNKNYLSIVIIFLILCSSINAENQPADIWNINDTEKEKNTIDETSNIENNDKKITESDIYNMQSQNSQTISINQSLTSKDINIIGLYDPEDYGLKIDMWLKSDGDQLKNLFSNISKLNLSKDASELMNILLLTNAYYPKKNISEKEFLKVKSDWLIKKKNLDLIEQYISKNFLLNIQPELTRFYIDEYLSIANISKACEIFLKNKEPINDKYLSKVNIYCLINDKKNEEAQLILDLKKETGFKDKYFEKKIDFLLGYTNEVDKSISEKSIFDFFLAHRTNSEFSFEPDEKTKKNIWKYLASSNLLYKIDEIQVTELNKISIIEKATHDKNYPEEDLFELYKRFQFNINQFLNAENAYKLLNNVEAKALIYQKILLESEIKKKLKLMVLLKNLFIKENIGNAFDFELKNLLEEIEKDEVPSNFKSFYVKNLENEKDLEKDIKFNNDILHQSKLVNYFNGDYSKSKIEKDINNFLKKIKKNKKYFLSKKDIILIESLKSDGIKILKKYENLYEIDESEMPTDIQVMVNNGETAATVLRIIEVIGQDRLDLLDEDSLYFIISALNQLDIDFIRNDILLKVLPLKV